MDVLIEIGVVEPPNASHYFDKAKNNSWMKTFKKIVCLEVQDKMTR